MHFALAIIRLLVACAAWAFVTAGAMAQPLDYDLRASGRGFQGHNHAQAMSVTLRGGRAAVTTVEGTMPPVRAELELAGFGREDRLVPVAVRRVMRRGGRIEHDRGPVREWFVNRPVGLQQGFDVARRPRGEGPLVLEIAFRGVTPELRGASRVALLEQGRERLSYDTLQAWDADGKALPARMQVEGGRVRLLVEDGAARYPLVVDPYVGQAKFTPRNPTVNNHFGDALAGDGNTIAVGAPGDRSQADLFAGAVHVFDWNGTAWVETAKVFPNDPQERNSFGSAVALSGDTMVVGAWQARERAESAGAAYVFVREGTRFRQQAKLEAPSPQRYGQFGYAVAIAGDSIAIGEWGHLGPTNESQGRVYVYTRSGETWALTAELAPRSERSVFGQTLAMKGDRLIVGAKLERVDGVTCGAAYVYQRSDDGEWALEAWLRPPQREPYQSFGISVDVEGDRVMVGSASDDVDGVADVGAVYLFERRAGTWQQRGRLTPRDASVAKGFGTTLDLDGNLAAIASGGTSAGVHVFARTNNDAWLEQVRLTSPEPIDTQGFGPVVLHAGGLLWVGSPERAEGGVRGSGAVYAFVDRPLVEGDPCRSGNECPTGYCVDGVCCAEACSGGTDDCRACNSVLTGKPSGTCAPLAEGSACGSGTDTECDGADRCSATGVCLDHVAANGTPCEAGAFCSVGDHCNAGACVEGTNPRCHRVEKCEEEQDLCYAACGDGTLDRGEQCDQGDLNSDRTANACRSDCRAAFCGDGVVDSGEECDLAGGNSDSAPNGCRSSCRRGHCGDGVVDSGESCDEGVRNGVGDAPLCRSDCALPSCGDGIRDPGEACDDGVLNSRTEPDACRSTCVKPYCGDGVVDQDEACDQGWNNADDVPDRCRTTCREPRCGDGVVDRGEACEPARDGARCTSACAWVDDASLPASAGDAGTPEDGSGDGGASSDHGQSRHAKGCSVVHGAEVPWFLCVQLASLALLRTARRTRRASGTPPH